MRPLDGLEIRGFKSIRHADFEPRSLNVLIGPNGAGKTNFIDLFRMIKQAIAIQEGFHAAVIDVAECRPDRFLPHIQPHEFEALLFSDPGKFALVEPAWQKYAGQLEGAWRPPSTPEHINDGSETHPSARLRNLLRPRYSKVRHGSAVSARVGLDRMRVECCHFGSWLARVEGLTPLRERA